MITDSMIDHAITAFGVAGGAWVGIRAALNGLREDTRRLYEISLDARDVARETRTEARVGLQHLSDALDNHAAEIKAEIRTRVA